jgi:hypothetical protein
MLRLEHFPELQGSSTNDLPLSNLFKILITG